MMQTTIDQETFTIAFERELPVSRAEVFDAWTKPEQIAAGMLVVRPRGEGPFSPRKLARHSTRGRRARGGARALRRERGGGVVPATRRKGRDAGRRRARLGRRDLLELVRVHERVLRRPVR
jgi:hypothetical protein